MSGKLPGSTTITKGRTVQRWWGGIFSPLDYFSNIFETTRCCMTAFNQTWVPRHVAIVRPKVRRSRNYFILESRVYCTVRLNEMIVLVTKHCIGDILTKGCNVKHDFRQRCALWDRRKPRVFAFALQELSPNFLRKTRKTGVLWSTVLLVKACENTY